MVKRFTVPGEPKGKGRPRFVKTGNYAGAYTPNSTTEYERLVAAEYIIVKIIADSLNKLAYHDDAQIVSADVRKYYSEEPRVEVTVENV